MGSAAEPRGDRRTTGKRFRAEEDELPVRQLVESAPYGAGQRALTRPPFEHDHPALLRGAEELRVDAFFDDPVLAGVALSRGVGSLR